MQDFLRKNGDIEDRISEYRESRDAFITQLKLVQNLQQELKSYADISFKLHQSQVKLKHIQNKNTSLIVNYEQKINFIVNNINSMKIDIEKAAIILQGFEKEYIVADRKVKDLEKRMKDLSDQEICYKKQAMDTENSVRFLTKLFRKSKYQSALDLATTYREKARECKDAIIQTRQEITLERQKVEKYCINKDNVPKQIQELNIKLKVLETKNGY